MSTTKMIRFTEGCTWREVEFCFRLRGYTVTELSHYVRGRTTRRLVAPGPNPIELSVTHNGIGYEARLPETEAECFASFRVVHVVGSRAGSVSVGTQTQPPRPSSIDTTRRAESPY